LLVTGRRITHLRRREKYFTIISHRHFFEIIIKNVAEIVVNKCNNTYSVQNKQSQPPKEIAVSKKKTKIFVQPDSTPNIAQRIFDMHDGK